jgi:endonuclease/exonuclease/phosphatase (EEP) superfamily protein YafD
MTQQHNVARLAAQVASTGGRPNSPLNEPATSGAPLSGPIAPRKRGAIWRAGYSLAWLIVLPLFAVAALRIFAHDANHFLTWLNAFTRYVYLPAYVCLGWAAWQRRWLLALVSLPVVACHLFWLAPDFRRDRRFDVPETAAAQDSTTLRIFFGNAAADNDDRASYLREIAEVNPDIVVLVEYYPPWQTVVSVSPVMQAYQYGTRKTIPFVGEIGIFSKLPIENAKQIWMAQRLNYTFDVRVDGLPLRMFCLHAPRPMDIPLHDYEGYWSKALPLILRQPDPAVVVGDFNATQYSHVYQLLTADRFRSAHDDRGRGYATTWPNGRNPLPPIRIDQAFLSPGVECVRIAEGRGVGSDHKPLILDVRIRPAARQPHPAERPAAAAKQAHATMSSWKLAL